jgi:hypothetical protein
MFAIGTFYADVISISEGETPFTNISVFLTQGLVYPIFFDQESESAEDLVGHGDTNAL